MARILIVDDSALSRRILRNILETAEHEVVEATDGVSALEKYFINKPDYVFLDLIMSGLNGLEVLANLRKMNEKAKVIVASADIQHSTRSMAAEGGAAAFINKPFVAKDILAAIESLASESPT
jgi:two-component system chemotaxis response regulator CheY